MKLEAGYTFTQGDQPLNLRACLRLTFFAFLGSFLCSLTGVGPGIFFSTVMVQLDMNLKVLAATASYVTLFTALSASINTIILKTLNVQYGLLIGILAIIGTVPGIYMQDWVMRKGRGRT